MSTAVVDHDIVTLISDELEAIDALLARLRAGDTPSAAEIDDALERGFGRLMALKVQARERRNVARLEDRSADPVIPELEHCIEYLAGELTELRVSRGPDRASRIGYGFVLPNRQSVNPAGRHNV